MNYHLTSNETFFSLIRIKEANTGPNYVNLQLKTALLK